MGQHATHDWAHCCMMLNVTTRSSQSPASTYFRQELGQELFEVPNLPDFDMLAWQPDAGGDVGFEAASPGQVRHTLPHGRASKGTKSLPRRRPAHIDSLEDIQIPAEARMMGQALVVSRGMFSAHNSTVESEHHSSAGVQRVDDDETRCL